MNVYDTLRESILSRKPCRISKLGQTERKVCPYLIGRSGAGEANVPYYQFEGYSQRGLQPDGSSANLRCNRVSEIATAAVIEEPWREPNQKPKTRGNCVVSIEVEVANYY